ncbi:hypothetical protein N9L06_02210 [Mariniblastus sp.]|nr:hypothetical protein [Mariniblastus sp.]
MGLELLARAAVASVSPTLLAEPDDEHKHLLHALGMGASRVSKRSIGTSKVLALCKHLFSDFTAEDLKAAIALINRRNDELHTGASAFSEYTTQKWLTGFYRCCKVLAAVCDESLEVLFGAEESNIAETTIQEFDEQVLGKVKSEIAAHKRVFVGLPDDARGVKAEASEKNSNNLAFQNHHRIKCPACESVATVDGTPFGNLTINQDSDEIVTQQAVMPERFACIACNLKFTGYSELVAAELGDQYTRTIRYAPEDYYGLVDPDDIDQITELIENHYAAMEYNND